jgi:hypothetical protein
LFALSSLLLLTLLYLCWTGKELTSWVLNRPWWQQLQANRRQEEVLDRLGVVVHWRHQCKGRVMRALEAEYISFLEAAAWFRRLNDQPGDAPAVAFPRSVRTPEERACRHVIGWAKTRNPALARQLEAELARVLAQPGGLVLPEPPPLDGITPCPERAE